MPVIQCATAGCSHLVNQHIVQNHVLEIPVIESLQNRLQFFSTSMSIPNVVFYSDIPALDGSLSLREEAEYTYDSIVTVAAAGVPPRWQRPTTRSRLAGVNGIPNWLNMNAENTMPDGILIGVRENAHHEGHFEIDMNNVIVVGGRNIRTAALQNNLLPGCPNHGAFRDGAGNQIYQNRCDVHGCDYHESTTSPLSIIDGQHRVMGLHESGIEDKHVTISLLPIASDVPGYNAYPIRRQAKIFEQVNSEGKPLKDTHLLWLKRMFGAWSTPAGPILTTGPDGRQAFDHLALLSANALPAPAATPWLGSVKFMEATGDFLAKTLFVTDPNSGKIEGTGAMQSNMVDLFAAAGLSGQTVQEIVNCWLEAWQLEVPAQFIPGTGLFSNERAFAALLRTMSISLAEIIAAPPPGPLMFNTATFRAHINPYAADITDPNWDRFTEEGSEEPQKNMYSLLKVMLRSGGAAGPAWATFGAAGVSWANWVNCAPDPITAFAPATFYVGGTNPPCPNVAVANARAVVTPASVLSWGAPVNIGRAPMGYWRIPGGPYRRINNFWGVMGSVCADVRLSQLDLGTVGGALGAHVAGAAGDFDLRLVYSNSAGTVTDFELGYTC
jgi:hypothetical protein